MKRHHMPDMKEGTVNVTPLIDVVMCLIVFFMLVAKIGVSTGIDKNIDTPKAYLGVSITDLGNTLALNLYEKQGANEPQVLVDIKGEGQKELRFMDKDASGKVTRPLREVLEAMVKERGANFKVIINASKSMRWRDLQLVMQECTLAGATNVNFAAKKEGQAVPG
jgi:biopolymer transport protein ExbD